MLDTPSSSWPSRGDPSAGLAAAKAGKSERTIMAQTGHRSVTMVRRYIREVSVFTDNAAAGLL